MISKKKKRLILVLSLAILMFLPLLYAVNYLGSVWDVYNKLDKVPVAFVNLDEPVEKNGTEYSLGRAMEEKLKENKKFDWKFVGHHEAMEGVTGEEYLAVIEIPENFSKLIADIQDGNSVSPEIMYTVNKGENYVFSQIASGAVTALQKEVSSEIQKEISKTLADNLIDVKFSLKDASSGSTELWQGIQKLANGNEKIYNGTQAASDGAAQLASGLMQAASSSLDLHKGIEQLHSGSNDLEDGLIVVADGSNKLVGGMNELGAGQSQISTGSKKMADGLSLLQSKLIQPNDKLSDLVEGTSNLDAGIQQAAKGASQLHTSVQDLGKAIQQASTYLEDSAMTDQQKIAAVSSILNTLNQGSETSGSYSSVQLLDRAMQQLSENLTLLKTGSQQISDGVGTLVSNLNTSQEQAASALTEFINGAKGLENGSNQLLSGIDTVSQKTAELAAGLEQLKQGSTQLSTGLQNAATGSEKLQRGLQTAANKTSALSNGLVDLNTGVGDLNKGLISAETGAQALSSGMTSGYQKMNGSLTFNSEDLSQFVAQPISLSTNVINDVPTYGEGLSPYFMSLSLWIGAMVLSMGLSIQMVQNLLPGKFISSYFRKFIFGAGLVSIQAILLGIGAILILDLHPANTFLFILFSMIISVLFYSVITGLQTVFGPLSSVATFIILMLQIPSSGGTFPIQASPAYYGFLNHIMPMTYTVNILRMVISGINYKLLYNYLFIACVIGVIYLSIGYVFHQIKNKKDKKKNSQIETYTSQPITR
ncbi:YhgE/Pip domain-containing protein [Paenibacillus sp. CGMCC 1.18879]|uniref:YhgE/Pip domain-containing protein n=1 Tax=Paenibacillus sp. CGMCC 1.18879 TaxID=2834466 RepID=UPI001CAA399B|nr:YhgE/Pip domain-containing protein [Paenibacillus sp. CGMCC 1.18879]MBY9080713.1 YhgE/Pip domain-containing protein [Paenibacillus sp. CGMCC 1.18879]